jgi:putative phosphotransacetylase
MVEFEVVIEGSGKHLHLSKEHLNILFGEGFELEPKKYLSQPGQYASNSKVDIVGPKGTIPGLTVIGPVRKETQVELSFTDARRVGFEPPIRLSGDLKGSPGCTLIGPKGQVTIDRGVIIAKRHLHCSVEDGLKYGIKDGDLVDIRVGGERGLIFENVECRVGPTHATYVHIDYDEVNAAALFGEVTTGRVIKKQ